MNSSPELLLALTVSAVFLLAGLVKGVTGLGLPTVAIGLLGSVLPPSQAAALLVVPTLITNVWQLAVGPSLWSLLRRLSAMMLAICAGTWLGGGLLVSDAAGRGRLALGSALVVYAVLGLSRVRLHVPSRAEPWVSPVIGIATGVVSAATGVFSVPAVPYLQSIGLEREELVQALGVSFTVSTLALALDLAHHGVLHLSIASASAMAIIPALAGMIAGQWLPARIRPEAFRFYFFLALLALGMDLALRALY